MSNTVELRKWCLELAARHPEYLPEEREYAGDTPVPAVVTAEQFYDFITSDPDLFFEEEGIV